MKTKHIKLTAIIIAIGITISACGGGSNSSSSFGTTATVNSNQNLNSLYVGNVQGLVFKDTTMINGTGFATTLDYNSVSALVEDSNGVIYAATTGGSVWQYNNNSGVWGMVAEELVPDGGGIFAMGVSSSNKLYVGTTGGNVFLLNNGVWQQQGGNQEVPSSGYIATMTIIDENVYVGTYIMNQMGAGQVYLVDNNSWTQLAYNPVDNTQILSLTNLNGTVYAGTTLGELYKITPTSWSSLGSTADHGAIHSLDTSNNMIYVGTNTGNIYSVNPSSSVWTALTSIKNPDGGAVMAIAIDETGTIYASTNNVMINDGAVYIVKNNSWNLYSGTASPDSGVNSLLIDPNNNLYAGTSGSSIYKVTDSEWIPLGTNSSPDNSSIYTVALYNSTLYVGTSAGNVYAVDSNNGWQHVGGSSSPDNSAIYSIAISNSGKVFASTYGNQYTTVNTMDSKQPHFVPKYKTNGTQSGSNQMGGNIYQVGDNGWTQVGGISSPDNSAVYSIAIANNDDIYAGTQNGSMYLVRNNNWQMLGRGMSPNNSSVFSVAVCGNNAYAAAGNSVYLVDTNAWKLQGGSSSPDGYAVYVVYCSLNGNTIYAGTSGGNAYSISNNTWTKLSSNYADGSLNYSAIYSFAIDPSNGVLYASTQSAGVWAYSNGVWAKTSGGNGATVYSIALGK